MSKKKNKKNKEITPKTIVSTESEIATEIKEPFIQETSKEEIVEEITVKEESSKTFYGSIKSELSNIKSTFKFKREEDGIIVMILIGVLVAILAFGYSFFENFSHRKDLLPYAESLANGQVIKKQSDWADYRLSEPVTRLEFIMILNTMIKKGIIFQEFDSTTAKCTESVFSDVSLARLNKVAESQDMCKLIEYLGQRGLLRKEKATDGKFYFNPDNTITRFEALKFLMVVFGNRYPVDFGVLDSNSKSGFVDAKPEMEKYFVKALQLNLITKEKDSLAFQGTTAITRGELFKIIVNLVVHIGKTK